jgi:hypothetical protein
MVKTGSMNMAKAIRRIGHRSGQARKMTFYRDAIESKDEYGVEYDTVASGNEGLTIPNIDAFVAPIITSSDNFTRAGHTVVGSATIYIPALSTIKKNVLGINSAGDTTARLASFNELESKDILYDMEKIIYTSSTVVKTTVTVTNDRHTYSFPSNTAGFEMDRLQVKVTDDDTTNRIISIVVNASGGKSLTWAFDSDINFDNAKYHIINLPLTNVSTGDKAYCIYVPSSGATGIRTVTATVGSSFDIKDINGETGTSLTSVVIISSATGMTTKDLHLYKAGEWRIENIKEYRDEYMELGCTKIRGERGSRRRAY